MKKLAIFVEGQTEQIFVEKLIKEIAGEHKVEIQTERSWRKNQNGKRAYVILKAASKPSNKDYYVLIRDCCGDQNVQSDIRSNYQSLSENKYEKILGLRDVYPQYTRNDIPILRKRMAYGIPTKPIEVKILLGIMEIEAWFLGETNHFIKIHSSLTDAFIMSGVKFNPANINVELRPHPALDLDKIYKLVNLSYTKNKSKLQKTVNALDYSNIYMNLNSKISSLGEFIRELDLFFDF